MTALVRIVPPDSYPVSLVEVKSHLNISHSDFDAKLDQLIATITQYLDGADGILDRCIMQQTWEYYLDNFLCCDYDGDEGYTWGTQSVYSTRLIELPLPPLMSIDRIEYYDADNELATVDASTYQIIRPRTPNMRSSLVPVTNEVWPITYWRSDAVKITFTAGYAKGHVPETLKQSMLMIISYWNENREAWTTDSLKELVMGSFDLMSPLRRMPV